MADQQSNAALPAYPLPEGAPRAGVIHVRHRHTDRFTVVGNHLAQHPRLSAVAIGLAVHIQSLPDGASVTVKALALRFPEGEITIRRAMNELEAAGYLERRRVLLGGGRFATRTIAYDRPGAIPQVPKSSARPGAAGRPDSAPQTWARPAHPPCDLVPAPGQHRPQADPHPLPGTGPAADLPATGPAADLLARLRLADHRLLLPARDVGRLVPAVRAWLDRGATPAQVTRTLTAHLPPEPIPIHHPARFLEHRLTVLLPPELPAEPASPERPAPLRTCDGCDRAFRTHDPGARCADCRAAAVHGPRGAVA